MLGIQHYFWRLIPANPILLRVVEGGGKRKRDLFIRCGYLGLLVAVVVFSLITSSSSGSTDLGALAKTSGNLFQQMSYLQLGLVALLAPIFTAGAITQEKDSQTYDILLSTPLTNGQIILGSLLSRLFFVVSLLVSGIPIFSITQIFGGVAIGSIALSFGIATATAFVTGAIAMAIATFKVGTRRTIFSFYLFIVAYLTGGLVLDQFSYFHVPGRVVQQDMSSHISWFTGINPFLALKVIFNDPTYAPPNFEELPAHLQRWPIGWYLSNPTAFYITFMFVLGLVMVMPSIVLMRKMAQSSGTVKTWVLQKLKISKGDRTRNPRMVWANPIAWREAKTKASAARATVLRYGFILAGLVGALLILLKYAQVTPSAQTISSVNYNADTTFLTIGDVVYKVIPAPDPPPYYRQESGPAPWTEVYLQRATVDPQTGKLSEVPFRLESMRGSLEVVEKVTMADASADRESSGTTGPRPARSTAVLRQTGPANTLSRLVLRAPSRGIPAEDARKYLLGLATVELAIILLIVTNAAASTVTREKEDGTLDLLLSSPITSRYYIWGKLRGLVYFVLPLVAVPVASVAFFIIYDVIRRSSAWDDPGFEWTVFPEAMILLPGMLVIVSAFAAILGMQMSLRCRTTVMAVMSSVGIVVGVCAGMGWCGYALLNPTSSSGGNYFALAAGSFSPFTLMQMLIAPSTASPGNYEQIAADDLSGRIGILFFTLVAIGVYTGVVWSMYTSMVKNFDMTIRKQSR